ncbi:MAG: hypothetical protein U0Q16_36630 [Bryobacteraceae bacterium]
MPPRVAQRGRLSTVDSLFLPTGKVVAFRLESRGIGAHLVDLFLDGVQLRQMGIRLNLGIAIHRFEDVGVLRCRTPARPRISSIALADFAREASVTAVLPVLAANTPVNAMLIRAAARVVKLGFMSVSPLELSWPGACSSRRISTEDAVGRCRQPGKAARPEG